MRSVKKIYKDKDLRFQFEYISDKMIRLEEEGFFVEEMYPMGGKDDLGCARIGMRTPIPMDARYKFSKEIEHGIIDESFLDESTMLEKTTDIFYEYKAYVRKQINKKPKKPKVGKSLEEGFTKEVFEDGSIVYSTPSHPMVKVVGPMDVAARSGDLIKLKPGEVYYF